MNILNKIKENFLLFQKGEKNYIPHPKELGKFTQWFAGRLPGDVTCITGGTSSAKTSLTKLFVFKAIEWAIENNKDYHVLWFGLEESEEQFEYSLLSFLIYQKSKGEVRYNIEHFEGLGKSIEEKHLKSIENIMPLFEKYKSYITFYETVSNSWGIYKEIRKFARQRGVFLKDNVPFTEEDFANSLQWNGYKKKNPDELVEVVIDHISELITQRDQKDLAAAMIDLIKNLRMYVAKVFKYSVIVVQQQMFEMENLDHIKEEQVYASLQGLGDSKVIGRAYLNVIGITNVNRYGIRIAKTDTGDININQFQDYQRVIGILKRRYGVVNKKAGLYFDGCSGWFEEIPKDQDKRNEMINKIKKLTEQI